MADGKVLRLDQVDYTAAEDRRAMTPLLMPGATANPFSGRGGRRPNGGLVVSVSGSPETWTVTAGAGVVYDGRLANECPFPFELPAPKSGPVGTRPGAGLTRMDLIVARVDTAAETGGVVIEQVVGTPGATAVEPQLPNRAHILARLTVPASGSITVTQNAPFTVAAGGILPVATTAERDALAAYRGLVVNNAQVDALQRHDGTKWKTLVEVDESPWVKLTLTSGHTGTLEVKLNGAEVWLSGDIDRSQAFPNGSAGYANVVAQLPSAAYRPRAEMRLPMAGYSGGQANGLLLILSPSTSDVVVAGVGAATTDAFFTGLRYPRAV